MCSEKGKPFDKARVSGSHPVFVSGNHALPLLGETGGSCAKAAKVRRVFEETDWANLAYHDPLVDRF